VEENNEADENKKSPEFSGTFFITSFKEYPIAKEYKTSHK
jgi:hypothetical protein